MGSSVKAYVLFKKNGKLALTTDKSKVLGQSLPNEQRVQASFEEQFVPSDMKAIKKQLKKLGLAQKD